MLWSHFSLTCALNPILFGPLTDLASATYFSLPLTLPLPISFLYILELSHQQINILLFLLYLKKKNPSDYTSPSSYHFISLLSFIASKLFKRCVYTHCFQFLFFPLLWKFFNQHVTPTPPLKPLVETAKNLHVAILKSFYSTALDMIGQILLCFLHLVFRILHSPDFSLTPWHFHLKIK